MRPCVVALVCTHARVCARPCVLCGARACVACVRACVRACVCGCGRAAAGGEGWGWDLGLRVKPLEVAHELAVLVVLLHARVVGEEVINLLEQVLPVPCQPWLSFRFRFRSGVGLQGEEMDQQQNRWTSSSDRRTRGRERDEEKRQTHTR